MKHLLLVENLDRYFMTHRLALAQRLRQHYRVSIACAVRDHAEDIQAAGFELHPLPLQREGMNPRHEWHLLRTLNQLYQQQQPDLIHHFNIKPVIYGSLAARRLGVPVVNTVTGLGQGFDKSYRFRYALITLLYRLALHYPNSFVTFQNCDDRQLFVDLGLVPLTRTQVVRGSGVDAARFKPVSEPMQPPIVLFAGRLLHSKGVADFVEVARRLQDEGLRFVLVGEPDSDNRDSVSHAQLAAWQEAGLVEYWGYRANMPDILSQSSLVVLPSHYREGIPKILIEAAACARPIVTYDRPGCREIVAHETNGLLVPEGDLDQLVDAVRVLSHDPNLRQQLGQAGRQCVLDGYTIEAVAAAFTNCYQKML